MNFKKKRLNKALEDKTYRVKLVHSNKGWLTVGLTFITLFSATMLSQKTVDASAVNNVATANSTTSSYVQLYNSVTSNDMHKANRGLENGTKWKTAKAVKGVDGETYLLVGGNEYANAKQMDLADETSTQNLTGVVRVGEGNGTYVRLYRNPMTEGAQLVSNRALASNTDWKTDQKVVVNGVTYYRVATDEWVKANDANLTSESSRSEKTYTKNAPDAETTEQEGNGSTTTPTDPADETATVTTKFVDENNKEIADAETQTAKVGSDVTVNAKTIEGYTLTNEATQKQTVSKDGNTITFTYKAKETTPTVEKSDVTVNYLDSEGNVLKPAKTVSAQEVGSTVSEDAPAIEGYTADSATKTLTVAKDNNSITFTYTKNATTPVDPVVTKANVTIKAVDENNKAIEGVQDTVLKDQEVGKDVEVSAPTVEGYTATEATKTVTVSKNGNTVTFKYTKDTPVISKADVTIKAVDENGKAIEGVQDTVLKDQEVGKDIEVSAPSIEGYTATEATKNVNVAKEGSTVTFTYTKNAVAPKTATITINYLDADGNVLQTAKTDTADVDSTYKADAPEIKGYTLDGDASQSITVKADSNVINFKYTKNAPVVSKANVTVNYLDADGNVLQSAKTLTDQVVGSTVTETAPAIKGYTVDQSSKSLEVVKDNNVINFTYTEDAPVQTVDTLAVANKVISLVNNYRTANSLSELNVDSNLTAGALARSLTEKGHVDASGDINSANHDEFMAQTQANLQQYGSTNMAENLAVTNGSTADEVAQNLFNQWKESPEHNATMLDKGMTDIGVGVQQLENGMFVGIQDFGGKATTANWDTSRFNTTTADTFGLTTDQIKDQFVKNSGYNLGTNYYVSDHIFKTKNDYLNFLNAGFDNPDPLEGSIWDSVGASGKATGMLVYDGKGNAVGWGLCLMEMDEPVSTYTDQGLTTWIK
ncbi:MucBP domain-containing protein [Companilactobacillus sp. FL22-1]|uniref:MucBP domain-containing protein n=1 Tax=Companilactobacillus sp. FL22-1 TaxID=3373892 RepID=UPI00375499F3